MRGPCDQEFTGSHEDKPGTEEVVEARRGHPWRSEATVTRDLLRTQLQIAFVWGALLDQRLSLGPTGHRRFRRAQTMSWVGEAGAREAVSHVVGAAPGELPLVC